MEIPIIPGFDCYGGGSFNSFSGSRLSPSLDLQFAADKSYTVQPGGSALIPARRGPSATFTRATGATQVNAQGLIEWAPENLVTNSATLTTQNIAARIGVTYTLAIEGSGSVAVTGAASASLSGIVGQRVSTTFTTISSGNITLTPSGTVTNAQLERSSTARTYLPTTSTVFHAPRYDYDPVTLQCKGLLIEENSTNLLLNSNTLSTQSATVTNVPHTLSFYGTGSIALSGTATATISGSGAYPSRTTYTFTPTAGSLTLTVTGSIRYAQLEAKPYATSYIPTTDGTLARAADSCSITGTSFTSLYNPLQNTASTGFYINSLAGTKGIYSINASSSERLGGMVTSSVLSSIVVDNNNVQAGIANGVPSLSAINKTAFGWAENDFAASLNGVTPVIDTSGTLPTPTQLELGKTQAGEYLNGQINYFQLFKKKLPNSKIQRLASTRNDLTYLDPDVLEFVLKTNATDYDNLNNWALGLKALGLWSNVVFWPMRSTQNASITNTVYSMGGYGNYSGTLVNGPTWNATGIRSESGALRYIETASFAQPSELTFVVVYADAQVSAGVGVPELAGRSAAGVFGVSLQATGLNMRAAGGGVALLPKTAGPHFVTAQMKSGTQIMRRNAAELVSGTTAGTFGGSSLFRMASSNASGTGYVEQAFCAMFAGTIDHETLRTLYKSTLGAGLGLP